MKAEEPGSKRNAAEKQEKHKIKPYYSDAILESDMMLDEDTAKNVTNVEEFEE